MSNKRQPLPQMLAITRPNWRTTLAAALDEIAAADARLLLLGREAPWDADRLREHHAEWLAQPAQVEWHHSPLAAVEIAGQAWRHAATLYLLLPSRSMWIVPVLILTTSARKHTPSGARARARGDETNTAPSTP